MSRMLHSVTWRNYFYSLSHFPHCSRTQQIRKLFNSSNLNDHVAHLEVLQKPAELCGGQLRSGQMKLSQNRGCEHQPSHPFKWQSATGKGSLLHQPWIKVLGRPLQKQNKKHRRPQVSCTFHISWSCSTSDPEPLQGDASSFSLSTALPAWISG